MAGATNPATEGAAATPSAAAIPSATPAAPPASAGSTPSARISPTIRPRPQPIAPRIAISPRRSFTAITMVFSTAKAAPSNATSEIAQDRMSATRP